MTAVQLTALALVLLGSVFVVLTRDLVKLVIANSLYGLVLVVLFLVFGAPDVALSELVVGTVAMPLAIVVALVKERGE
ncbi:MAG TPA: hydrogenase subunit MbhD domain-containing protein [Gaiellaceae bacterium]|nr:hydrogenase subunit MbhD domain-containing protein [Gaiellaceae bacterium]